MTRCTLSSLAALLLVSLTSLAHAQTAGTPGANDLIVAQGGATQAVIVVAPGVGTETTEGEGRKARKVIERAGELKVATDLAKYIELMSGAKPTLVNTGIAPAGNAPVFLIGEAALKAEPSLQKALDKVAKKDPVLEADAVVVRRTGNKVFLAGTNVESHYHAMIHLLNQWGCRWYLPTDIGEVVPTHPTLRIGQLDFSYAPPFEVRHYWNAWNGSGEGAADFRLRNFMVTRKVAGMGHALAKYTGDLAEPGKSHFNVPFSEDKTAQHVAAKIDAAYAKGDGSISLAIEDGAYQNDSPADKELIAGIRDKYFYDATSQRESLTDPMMVFYNKVAKILREKYPQSNTKLGGMAYVNVTIPPQRQFTPERNLIMWLAPIDIDPNHGMDDPKSPPRQEYRDMMYRWSEIMQGRIVIYDYDQGYLVWRDLPNPSHYAVKDDMKHYRKAGILGIGTETRGATATVFLNFFFRGQLMWNPDADVDKMLAEFYPNFYGPAAKPMAAYWNAIFKAWEDTIVTEHEHFAAPAIYTPELVAKLKGYITEAQAIIKPLDGKADATRQEKQYLERMKFTQLSFDIIENHRQMVTAAATEGKYKEATEAGQRAFKAIEAMLRMNPTFVTGYSINKKDNSFGHAHGGAAWWLGEVKQYEELAKFTDGTKGTLITQTPLEWGFRRDPNDSGLASGWAQKPIDLTHWNANGKALTAEARKDYPTTEWELLRTDIYPQAQGIRFPDQQSYTGHMWYRTEVDITAAQAADKINIRFPGIFNSSWLYVNGDLVNYRFQGAMWWRNNYKFEWDADLTGKLKPGKNTITVRLHNPHHFGGIFRRPFLYKPVPAPVAATPAAAPAPATPAMPAQ